MSAMNQSRWLTVSALGLIVLVGAAVRLSNLHRHSVTHVEMYVPGIHLPANLVEFPLPRLNLAKVVSGCIRAEPHPPLYYMLMLAWTDLFGTSVLALRLPSALCGIACIPVIYALGAREAGKATGLVAAAMLALNGHQLFWSQFRGYIVASLLGLASSLLLLKLVRDHPRPLRSLVLYCGFVFMGLAMEVYFWPIFLTQMFWVAVKGANQACVPTMLRWQLWIFLAASPLWALAAHQSQIPSHLSTGLLPFVSQFFDFGFLFEENLERGYGPGITGATLVLSLAGLILTAVGLASRDEAASGSSSQDDEASGFAILPEPAAWLRIFAIIVALLAILALGACSFVWGGKRTGPIMATTVVPPLLFLADPLVRRWWPKLRRPAVDFRSQLPGGLRSLSGFLTVVPVTMILVASIAVSMLASRGALLYTPYLIVMAGRGLVSLVRWNPRWLVLGGAVGVAHVLSVIHARDLPMNPRDYRALSRELAAQVKEPDLIFVVGNNWQTTPIFYYLDADRYHFVGKDFSRAISTHPDSRVWVVTWTNNKMLADVSDALTGYRPTEEIAVLGAHAVLHEPTVASHERAIAGESSRPKVSQAVVEKLERTPPEE
jgi:4-amino-4-deoxy-L-arabinose transferase-like glycosyltransferase